MRVSQKDVVYIDVRKPNSAGADFAVEKANKLFQMMGEYVNVPKQVNKQVLVNANRWTPVGLENQGCVEVVDNNVVGYPAPDLTMRSIVCTELRNADLCSVIKNVYPRNGEQQTLTLGTVDLDRTNKRSLSVKYQTNRPNFSGKCTNCLPGDVAKNEEFKTMLTVIAAMPPGAPAYFRVDASKTAFNDVRCDKNQSRDRAPEAGVRRSLLVKLLTGSHLIAAVLVALPNQAGVVPYEISEPVLALLDWVFLYIRNHVTCVFDTDVIESFNRMKEGYESRHVVYSLFKATMAACAEDLTPEEAAAKTTLCMATNAMTISEVPCVAHSFLTRGVHYGMLAMVTCTMLDLNVPIIPMHDLCEFFTSDQASI